MPEQVIVDTSTLIALEKIGLLPILCKLYSKIIVPEEVIKEFGSLTLKCLSIKKVKNPLQNLLIKELNLGKGESAVISLAQEMDLRVIIDETKARRVAENLGLKVSGTIGILLKAEKSGLIKSAYQKVKELKEKGFYVSDKLLNEVSKIQKK